MGWSGANHIFDRVCRSLLHVTAPRDQLEDALVTLIEILQEGDWDTEDESLDRFTDSPVAVRAFARCGIYLPDDPRYRTDF